MDCVLSYTTSSSIPNSLLIPVKNAAAQTPPPFRLGFLNSRVKGSGIGSRRALIVVAGGTTSSSHCEFSGLNAPLEPSTPSGRLLSTILQNDREYFPMAVEKQLEQLAYDRDEAVARMTLSLASDEACLHRRIADMRLLECQAAVEDVMYILIFYKFSEIWVRLVPRLSKCIYNSRLEIWPSRDWQLESIHNLQVMDMVKEHLATVIGWTPNSKVTDNWAPTQVRLLHLCQVYTGSILYGYFLKSASLRHHLESMHFSKSQLCPFGQAVKQETLKSYVMSFDPETLQMCAKPKSKAAVNLIERHTNALFGDGKVEISTSLATLKRIVLEAIAFGSFLWDTAEYTSTIYNLDSY